MSIPRPDPAISGYATADLCDYFERQCDRFVNGRCTTRRCVTRGRALNRDGLAPIYGDAQVSTCEAFEAAHIIAAIAGREYGPDYEMAPANKERARKEVADEARALGRLISQ